MKQARAWIEALNLEGRESEIARDVIVEIKSRLEFLEEVGLGYLTLDRAAPTLSGGEAQRIKLSLELSKRQQGSTLYILDEPTTGLHWTDIQKLMDLLFKLRDAIDQYYADKNQYPPSLDDLVSAGYIRAMPKDPITNSTSTWQAVPADV